MKKSLLFTIVMALLCLFGNVKAQTEVPGSFSYPADAWIWTGNGSDSNWDTQGNWTPPTNSNNEVYPGQSVNNDKVYIPVVSTQYPTVIINTKLQAIYLESGAMLKRQYLLDADQWYTDIKVPTNRWILVASPLKGVLSGDFYTAAQGGTYTGALAPSVYNGEPGGSTDADVHNRRFPYIVYERLFSNATRLRYAAYDSIVSFSPTWANPTNAMAYQFQPGEALEILARGNYQAGVTGYEYFHFPSNNDEYYYFNSLGQITKNPDGTDFKEVGLQDKRTNSGKPVFDSPSTTIKLERNTSDLEGQHEGSPLWAVGNPAFASLDILKFLKENVRLGYTARYLYKHVAGNGEAKYADGEGDGDVHDVIYYLDRNGNALAASIGADEEQPIQAGDITTKEPYINSNRGFKVVAGTGVEQETHYPEWILGDYEMQLDIHESNWDLDRHFIWWNDVSEGTNTSLRQTNVNITISKDPSNPNNVIISNFCGFAQPISAYVNTTTQTIDFNAGQVLGNYSGWTRGTNRSNNVVEDGSNIDMVLMVPNKNSQIQTQKKTITENVKSGIGWLDYRVQTDAASNVDKQTSFHIRYYIENDKVKLESTSGFAAYPDVSTKTNFTNYYYVGNVSTSNVAQFYCSAWNCFDSYSGEKDYVSSSTTGQTTNKLSVLFTDEMFTTTQIAGSQLAPRRTAAHGNNLASINVNYNNRKANSFIIRDEVSVNGYDTEEDAAVLGELDEEVFSLSTLAGKTRVAVNALNDTTRCQIVLTGVNGDVDLVFDNLAALGENVRLFDANDSTYAPLNGNHATTTVTFGVNDSPLRYSLVWDYTPIIAGNETLTAIDFTAFSPAKGEVKVMSNELLKGVRVYNAAGQLITSNNANANEVSFSNLLSGIYVIEAYTANGKATKKVDVK